MLASERAIFVGFYVLGCVERGNIRVLDGVSCLVAASARDVSSDHVEPIGCGDSMVRGRLRTSKSRWLFSYRVVAASVCVIAEGGEGGALCAGLFVKTVSARRGWLRVVTRTLWRLSIVGICRAGSSTRYRYGADQPLVRLFRASQFAW